MVATFLGKTKMTCSFDLRVARIIGQEIVDIEFNEEDNYIRLNFGGPLSYYIQDDGQSCCELRYMKTDDDPLLLRQLMPYK